MNIELTEDEVRTLLVVLANVGGDPLTTWRKHINSAYHKLNRGVRTSALSLKATLALDGQHLEFQPDREGITGAMLFVRHGE